MFNWDHHIKVQDSDTDLGSVWMGHGGGGMAVIACKEHGYEVTAWWTGQEGRGQLTGQPPPVFPSLEKAQQEVDRLIFGRTPDWTRLLED